MRTVKEITGNKDGFSMVELLVYIGIFAASAVFLIGILLVFTRIHLRQTALNEVNQQISFVNNTVQRLVREASLVDMTAGNTTTTLKLLMASSTISPTKVYLEDSTVYLKEGSGNAEPLTDSNVTVNDFKVTKYENPGANDTVQMQISLDYNTDNSQAQYKRALQSAVSRASAVTFDSNVVPNADNSYDIGNSSQNWKDAYFSGNIGLGTSPVSGTKIKSTGDIAVTTSTAGLVLTAPNGSCYRITINNSGNVATSSVSCP